MKMNNSVGSESHAVFASSQLICRCHSCHMRRVVLALKYTQAVDFWRINKFDSKYGVGIEGRLTKNRWLTKKDHLQCGPMLVSC